MRRFIPSQIDEETKIVKSLSFLDLAILFAGALFIALVLASSLPSWAKILLVIIIAVTFILAVMSFDMVKGYKLLMYGFLYLLRRKKYTDVDIEKEMGLRFDGTVVKNGSSYVSVIELNGIDFSILEERTQDEYISIFADVLKEIKNGKIIKLEKPLDLSKFIDYNERLTKMFFERQFEAEQTDLAGIQMRLEMIDNQNEFLKRFHYIDRIFVEGFYLVIIEPNDMSCSLLAQNAVTNLNRIGLQPKLLDEKGLRVFMDLYLKNNISEYFADEKPQYVSETVDIEDNKPLSNAEQPMNDMTTSSEAEETALLTAEAELLQEEQESVQIGAEELEAENPEGSDSLESAVKPSGLLDIQEKSNRIVINKEETRVIALGKYPTFVLNAWAYELFSIPGTKIVFNFSDYPSKNVAKRISRSMTELNSRLNNAKAREDEKKKWLTSYQSLDALLEGLEFDNEKLHNTECYLIYPKDRHREILKIIRGKGIKINDLLWTQYDGWLCTNPFIAMPAKNNKERISSIQTTSLAGMFPFVAKILLDDDGFYLGASTRYPIFFNQFTKSQTRVNHNMVVLGKSGGGKSFFMKKLAMRGAMEDKKIFILDPDNEYDYLCDQLHGNWIDVAGERVGRMNPLHVFASMKDDDATNVGDVASHKLFLEEFFRTVLPDMSTECRLYLNECISDLYVKFDITDMTALSTLEPKDFPTFSDLFKLVEEKQFSLTSESQKEIFEMLKLYLKQFVGDGLYARLWNGETTLNISNDFNVLNFQSLFANNNTAIANGQMLLLMRFLNQEVIKNRELNKARPVKKHIEVWIDEAHRFINPEFPVALKFMSTMAKQIRKYDGGLIVTTQNIADFVGVSESMRAMATAVINSCQYSMIFGLLANDINQIKDLYANYNGGFTQQEIDFIGHAKQGDALFIVDINTRLPLHIELYDNELQYLLPASMR